MNHKQLQKLSDKLVLDRGKWKWRKIFYPKDAVLLIETVKQQQEEIERYKSRLKYIDNIALNSGNVLGIQIHQVVKNALKKQ